LAKRGRHGLALGVGAESSIHFALTALAAADKVPASHRLK
jgi:hypothetical protein